MRVVARDDRAYQRPSRTTTTSPQTLLSSPTSVSNGIGVSFSLSPRTNEGCIIEGKKWRNVQSSSSLGKKWDEEIFSFSQKRRLWGKTTWNRRRAEVVVVFRAVRGARAFVDHFSTLVIQQLFWGTRVYRTSPLKTNILCNESIVTAYLSVLRGKRTRARSER